LVIRSGALGDFILTLPVFQALKEWKPGSAVEVVINPAYIDLALASGYVAGARSIDTRDTAYLFQDGPLPVEFREYLEGFDLIVSFFGSDHPLLRRHLLGLNRPEVILHPARPPENRNIHAAEFLLTAVKEKVQPLVPSPRPRLEIPGKIPAARRLVAVHPGSGSPDKVWPAEHFARAADLLAAEHRVSTAVIYGPADRDYAEAMVSRMKHRPAETWDNLPLVELARKLKECRVMLGNDSGISHLAAALSVPTVTLFGPSDPSIWRPLSPRSITLRGRNRLSTVKPKYVAGAIVATGWLGHR